MINIEKEPRSINEYYDGVYTDDSGTEWKFTIGIRRDIDRHFTVEEIDWIDGSPQDEDLPIESIENQIEDLFYARQ